MGEPSDHNPSRVLSVSWWNEQGRKNGQMDERREKQNDTETHIERPTEGQTD